MNDIIFEVIKSVVVIAIMVLVRYAVPYLKSKVKNSNLAWIYDWAVYAVKAAEQTTTGTGKGSIKKANVKAFLSSLVKEYNLEISDAQIENLIESAVFVMKQEEGLCE